MKYQGLIATVVGATLTGCIGLHKDVQQENLQWSDAERLNVLAATQEKQRAVRVTDAPYVPAAPKVVEKHDWLRNTRITVTTPDGPFPVSELVRMLRANGINVTSQLPLASFTYSGYGVTNVDGVTALNILLGTAGLDYEINDSQRFVEIMPMKARSWSLNLSNRTTNFKSSGDSTSGGANAGGGAGGSGLSGVSQSNAQTTTEDEMTVELKTAFWDEVKSEIESRLTYLIPTSSAPSFTGPSRNGASAVQFTSSPTAGTAGNGELFREVKVGRVSTNPTTGWITVQAPRYVLDEIDDYIRDIDLAYNTRLEFEGRLFLVTSNRKNSRGVDIAAFAEHFSDKLGGLVFRNNALSGVTFALPDPVSGTPLQVAGTDNMATTVLGTTRKDGLLNIFNAYLENYGSVRTVQRPYLVTSSGVPTSFSETNKTYVNLVQEQTSSTEAGNTTARENQLLPFEFGTSLRINPFFDAANDRVRMQLSLTQVIQNGFLTINQFVQGENGAQTVPTDIPLDRRVSYQGEAIVPTDAMIVLGGLQLDQTDFDRSGLPGTRNTVLGGITGRETEGGMVSTYYFAVVVRAVPVTG